MADNRETYKRYHKTDKYKKSYWNSHLKRKYGISIEDYQMMLEVQQYKCKICGCDGPNRDWLEKEQRAILFVDHNHTTGVVRGLLCNTCNVGLAMFKDNIEHLTSAISYLREN